MVVDVGHEWTAAVSCVLDALRCTAALKITYYSMCSEIRTFCGAFTSGEPLRDFPWPRFSAGPLNNRFLPSLFF